MVKVFCSFFHTRNWAYPHFFVTNVRYVVLSTYLGFQSFQLSLSVQMLQRPPISFRWWKLADIKPLLNIVHPIGISSISWHFCWYIWIVFLYCVSDEELSVCGHQEYHWAMFFPFCYSQLSYRMTSLYIQCCARTQPRMPTVPRTSAKFNSCCFLLFWRCCCCSILVVV